jgi:hypothetical protein
MNGTILAICFLGPPAVYGLACILEDLAWDWQRARRRRHGQEAARRRHPSRPVIGPEDMPDWGQR